MILTLNQALRHSQRLDAAAMLLFANGFFYQAVARAYYSVHVLTDFTARRSPSFQWPVKDGVLRPRAGHDWTAVYVHQMCIAGGRNPQEAKAAGILASELQANRVSADYYGYMECPKSLAQRLLTGARALIPVLTQQATRSDSFPLIRP